MRQFCSQRGGVDAWTMTMAMATPLTQQGRTCLQGKNAIDASCMHIQCDIHVVWIYELNQQHLEITTTTLKLAY